MFLKLFSSGLKTAAFRGWDNFISHVALSNGNFLRSLISGKLPSNLYVDFIQLLDSWILPSLTYLCSSADVKFNFASLRKSSFALSVNGVLLLFT